MLKINLISAEVAAKETEAARNRARDEQMEEIITAINAAIDDGEYSVKIRQKLNSENAGVLKRLGYRVIDSSLEGHFIIRWNQNGDK